jgi:hypothetical protein
VVGLVRRCTADDRQGCASAGDSEVGRRPEVATHAGADTNAGVFAADRVSGAAFEPSGQNGNRQRGWVCDQEVHVVGFAVELDQFGVEVGAHSAHGVLGEGEHGVGEHPASVLGCEHQVCVQQRHVVPAAAVGRGCQWPPLRLCCG